MEVLLDSSFIISCVKKRIDFLDELSNLGFKPVLPREVMQEMKDLRAKKISREEREAIDIAFEMFEKTKIKKMSVGGRFADDGLIAHGKKGIYIATLDREIKNKVPNKILIESGKDSLKVVRD